MIFESFKIDHLESVKISRGIPYSFDATIDAKGVNFAVAARDTHKVVLSQDDETDPSSPSTEIEFVSEFYKTGNVWHERVEELPLTRFMHMESSLFLQKNSPAFFLIPM